MPQRNLKVDSYKYQFFQKSDPFIYQSDKFYVKFWTKLPDFFKRFHQFDFLNFGSNLGKCWKIDPLIYKILHFIRGHSYTPRGWFCYPCWWHIPVGSFVLSTLHLAEIIDQIYTVQSVFSNWKPFLPPLCTLY